MSKIAVSHLEASQLQPIASRDRSPKASGPPKGDQRPRQNAAKRHTHTHTMLGITNITCQRVTKRPDQLALLSASPRAAQNRSGCYTISPMGPQNRLQNRFQNQRRPQNRPQNRSQNYPQNLNLRCHQNLRRRWTHLRFTGFCSHSVIARNIRLV
uniref:Uncharacterized protein n=1 Tax=Halimeda minima TaxID=170427 RepID=A0A386AYZ1_9CHLO|nr:hypothetical protein [Halimeda minima]